MPSFFYQSMQEKLPVAGFLYLFMGIFIVYY